MEKYTAIKDRAEKYKNMLERVEEYRAEWHKSLKNFIKDNVNLILEQIGMDAEIKEGEEIKGMETIMVRLGTKRSGIFQELKDGDKRPFWKDFGAISYNQLFNGKVQVWMTHPIIEGLMEPPPPKLIGIYAPPEFNEALMIDHFDNFLKELTEWEDYDDDDPVPQSAKIGFGAAV